MGIPVLLTADHIGTSIEKCAVPTTYVKALLKAGVIPYIAPLDFGIVDPIDIAKTSCAHMSGVLLTGGADIDSAYYGEMLHEKAGEIDQFRDRFEIALVKEAIKRELPILGICRGSQIINVALSGTLYQDLPSQAASEISHNAYEKRNHIAHTVEVVKEDSILYKATKSRILDVNSGHHQAVKDLGKGLSAVAKAPDGIIEAIELENYIYLLGVQWHPEDILDEDDRMMSIFNSFAEAVKGRIQ